MSIARPISMRHSAYCCPKCHGPIRLMPNVMSGPENHYAYCGSCYWMQWKIVSDTPLGAITAWNKAVREESDTKGLPPEALPISDAAIIDACARVQGWIDFPSDGGEGAYTWYFDVERAPFCECLDKLRYDPIKRAHQANELAFVLRMILHYDPEHVTATTPELQSLGFQVTVPVVREEKEKRSAAEVGGDAMQRAIATAAARHFQHGFHLASTGDIQLAAAFKDVATSDLRARAIATRTPCPECHTEQVEFVGAHPDHEPLWAMSEDGEVYGRSAVQIPHPMLGENMFRITYVDDVAESAFALSIVTKVAVSVGPNKPDAFSESQLKTLTK